MSNLTHLPSIKSQSFRHRKSAVRGRLQDLGASYLDALAATRELGGEIERQVVAAQADGQSMAQISEASGLSVSQLEYIVVAAECQRPLPTF
ncbi:hypothetical protein BH09ACT7_BH09ACT7_31770 [soil metagenome]